MRHPKRLHNKHLRLIFTIAVDMLTLAETLLPWIGMAQAHYIRATSTRQEKRIAITIAIASMQVLIITMATARVWPYVLLLIPTFSLYLIAMFVYRQYRLDDLSR